MFGLDWGLVREELPGAVLKEELSKQLLASILRY